jgi:hypothetical protein
MQSLLDLDRYAADARNQRDKSIMLATINTVLELFKTSMESNGISEKRAMKIISEIENTLEVNNEN